MRRTYPTIFGTRVTLVGSIAGIVALLCGLLSTYWTAAQLPLVGVALLMALFAIGDGVVASRRDAPTPVERDEEASRRTGTRPKPRKAGSGWLSAIVGYRYIGKTGREFSLIGLTLFWVAMPLSALLSIFWRSQRDLFVATAILAVLGANLDAYLVTRASRRRAESEPGVDVDGDTDA